MSLALLINEDKPLNSLLASATTGGIGFVPPVADADQGQSVSIQTFRRIAGVVTDSFVAGDVLHIGIGDGLGAPVCYVSLSSASPSIGTLPINTAGMVALFDATDANQIQLQVAVARTRGAYTNTVFSAPITILRSAINPATAVPTPSILGTGVAAALLVAVNTALGFVRTDSLNRLPALDGSQLTNLPSSGSGTVTSVSVTTANGISGTVLNPTTTPAITIVIGDGAITNTQLAGGIADAKISSAATWNAKQGAITFGAGTQAALAFTPNVSGGFLTTVSTGKMLWVDSVNGLDVNAGTFTAPFLTLAAAKAAAASGDTETVRPGSFTASASILKTGVNLTLEPGVTITQTGVTASVPVLGDGGSAMTCDLTGSARIVVTYNGADYFGPVHSSHASTVLTVACRSIAASTAAGNTAGVIAVYGAAGTLFVDVEETISASDAISDFASAVYWGNGPMFVRAPKIVSTQAAVFSQCVAAPTGDFHVTADWILGTGTTDPNGVRGVVTAFDTNTSAASWVRAGIVQSSSGVFAACCNNGSGKLYVTAQKIYGRVENVNTPGLSYITTDKVEAVANGSSTQPGLLYVTTGTMRATCRHWQPLSYTGEMIKVTGGTTYIRDGDYTGGASANGIEVTGGTVYLENMVIDTSANASTNGLTVSGGTVYLINCKIAAHASGKDVAQSGGTVTVTGGSGSGTLGAFTTSGTVGYTKAPTALLADTVTTNANLTGPVTSTGNATAIANGAISNAMLANAAVANLSGTNTGDQTSVSGNAGTATALANARTLWGQSFNGTANVTGSLTDVGNITGGASSMVILSGTGNSRTLTLQTTTSGGTATNAIFIGNDQIPIMSQNALGGAAGGTLNLGGAGGVHFFNGTITTSSGGMRLGRGTSSALGFSANWFTGSNDVSLSSPSAGVIAVNTSTYDNALGSLLLANLTASGNVIAGTPAAHCGGTIFTNFTSTSSTSTDGTENDLYSNTLVANTLGTNGDNVEQIEHISFVSSATAARRVRKYFAGTLIFDSGSLTLSLGGEFSIFTTIIRESSSVVRCDVLVTSTSASTIPYSTYTRITGLTLSSTNVIKTTGVASGAGAASGDISNTLSTIRWFPA